MKSKKINLIQNEIRLLQFWKNKTSYNEPEDETENKETNRGTQSAPSKTPFGSHSIVIFNEFIS